MRNYSPKCGWQKENKCSYQMCSMGHMTFIFEIFLTMMKVNMHAKNEDSVSRHSKFIVLTGRQTDTHTHTHTEMPLKTLHPLLSHSVKSGSPLSKIIRSTIHSIYMHRKQWNLICGALPKIVSFLTQWHFVEVMGSSPRYGQEY